MLFWVNGKLNLSNNVSIQNKKELESQIKVHKYDIQKNIHKIVSKSEFIFFTKIIQLIIKNRIVVHFT